MKKYVKITALMLAMLLVAGCAQKNKESSEQTAQTETITNVEVSKPEIRTMKDEYKYNGTLKPKDTVNVVGTLSANVEHAYYEVGEYVAKDAKLFDMDTEDVQLSINSAKASLDTVNANIRSAQTGVDLANGSSMESQLSSAKNNITNCQTSLENAKTAAQTAQKGVDNADIQIKQAEIGVKNAQTAIDNAQIALNNAQIALNNAQQTYSDNRQLYEVGGISMEALNNSEDALEQMQNSYNTALNAYNSAQAGYDSANASYQSAVNAKETASNSLTTAQRAVQSAQTALEKANDDYDRLKNTTASENSRRASDSLNTAQASKSSVLAAIDQAQSKLDDASVSSPISGVVLEKNVTVGGFYSAGQTAYKIADTSSMDIEVNISENISSILGLGSKVDITIPSISDEKFEGAVSELSPEANSDGTYKVKVRVPNPDGKLVSGKFANISFAKEESANALSVPRNSVIHKDDEYYVFIIDGDKAVKKNVQIGIDNGDYIEIKKGISVKDDVVTTGQTYLKDGDKVNIVAGDEENSSNTEVSTEVVTEENSKKGDSK